MCSRNVLHEKQNLECFDLILLGCCVYFYFSVEVPQGTYGKLVTEEGGKMSGWVHFDPPKQDQAQLHFQQNDQEV